MMKRTGIDLAGFLANAPSLFGEEATLDEEVDPDIADGMHHGAIRHFDFENGDILSCVRWDSQYHITSTDIIRALVHRFQDIGRPVVNMKKFEEGVFSDLRSLKPGSDARLEPPRSEFLELLYKHHCVRTQKKQKVFYWNSVPHDLLFREALERDLKREAMGIEPTTKIGEGADPNSLVEIDGVELPLSVPPTLAVHARVKHADDSSSGCFKTRVSSTQVYAKPSGESEIKKDQISTVSSAVSLHSMASQHSREDIMIDTKPPVVYPESNSSYTDSADYSSAFDITNTAAIIATAASAAAVQGHNGVNNSSISLTGVSAAQRQPSLSEYVTRKSSTQDTRDATANPQPTNSTTVATAAAAAAAAVAGSFEQLDGLIPINDSWTGVNFMALHKQASELRKNYDEYQPTPTPHHSPKEGAVSEKELLDMLEANPNALVTPDNIGNFNILLDQLLGSSGSIQEASQVSVSDASAQGLLFGDSPSIYQPQSQAQQQQFSFSKQASVGLGGAAIAASQPMAMDLGLGLAGGIGINVADSMNSSPSVSSLMSAHRISANGTPETAMDSLNFGGVSLPTASVTVGGDNQDPSVFADNRAYSIDDIDKLIATAGTTSSNLPAISSSPQIDSTLVSSVFSPYNAAISGGSQIDIEASRGTSALKQTWSNQKPQNSMPNHRSTRFSRYHPYLKTMARIAYRDSHTLLNRVPSTADPNVAAAAVNAIAANIDKSNRIAGSGVQQGTADPNANMGAASSSLMVAQQASESAMLLDSESNQFSDLGNTADDVAVKRPGQRAGKGSNDDDGEEIRRYGCTYSGCTKQFKRHEHLKRHFRTHTGERPYKCSMPDCGKVFARMDNLNQHARTHINRKTADRRISGGHANDSKTSISVQNNQPEPRLLQQDHIDDGTVSGQATQQNVFSIGGSSGGIPSAFGDMSLFGTGGMPAFVSGNSGALVSGLAVPPAIAAASIPSAASVASVSATTGLDNAQQQAEFGPSTTAAGNMRNYNAILSIAKDLSSAESQSGGMRISEPPEDLSMFNRGLMGSSIGSGASYPQKQQQLLQQQQSALQSPAIENNAVSMLRKMSKNNRPRGIVSESSLGISSSGGDVSSAVDGAYGFRNFQQQQQQQFMSAFASNAMSAFGNTVEQAGSNNGVGFGDLQAINSSNGGDAMGMDSMSSTIAGESNVSSISTTWLASFLAQSQQQQQQQQQPSPLTSMQMNVSSPPAYLSPYSGNTMINLQQHNVGAVGRQMSLKRHLDEEEDSDVVMRSSSKDRSRQSMNVSEDEHSDSKMTAATKGSSSSNSHKFSRPSIAPKPTLSPV